MFLSSNFLGIPEANNGLETSRVVVLPVPYERTVSYGVGTRNGPAAILEASHYVELYDDELQCEPYLGFGGVATVRAPVIARPMEAALGQLAGLVEAVAGQGKFPLVLGGEHALTAGAIRPFAARHKDLVLVIIQSYKTEAELAELDKVLDSIKLDW